MFSLESPHQGDSNEYTQYTIFNIKKKLTLNYPKFAAMGFFSKGLKNEFEVTIVKEPSVFEPLKFYCISLASYFSLYVHCIRFDSIEASTDIRWHYNHLDITLIVQDIWGSASLRPWTKF